MKKLTLLALAAILMTACGNKTKPAAEDTDSAAVDSTVVEEQPDTVPRPLFVFCHDPEHMQVVYWTVREEPNKKEFTGEMAKYYAAAHEPWVRQDSARRLAGQYSKLFLTDTKAVDIKYTGEITKNPDGEDASFGELHSRKEIPAQGLKYTFVDVPKHLENSWYVITTGSYLQSRKPLKMIRQMERKNLPANIVKQLEKQYGMTANRSELVATIDGHYTYGVLQFKPKGKKVTALDVIADGDKAYSVAHEAEYNSDGSIWNVDDDGEYFASNIAAAFEGSKGPELYYVRYAPESCTTGVMMVRDGKMEMQEHAMYQSMVDEEQPLWKKDIAQMKKLYQKADDDRGELQKWTFIDLDGDGINEVWLRDKEDQYGAFYTFKNGKIDLLVVENPRLHPAWIRPVGGKAYLSVSGSAGGPAVYTSIVALKNSTALERFTMLEVYGEIDDASLNEQSISKEKAASYYDKLPEAEELKPYYWREYDPD